MLFILPFTVSAQIYTGKIISVKDGDSFELLTEEDEIIEIRLAHVDTPEKKQPYGKAVNFGINCHRFLAITVTPWKVCRVNLKGQY